MKYQIPEYPPLSTDDKQLKCSWECLKDFIEFFLIRKDTSHDITIFSMLAYILVSIDSNNLSKKEFMELMEKIYDGSEQ